MKASSAGILKSAIAACVFLMQYSHANAADRPEQSQSRGAMLYSTHCIACHTTHVHWRDKRLVTDWDGLEKQVRRWQTNQGLTWEEGDVKSVARYLNKLYYHFPRDDNAISLK